MATVLKSLLWFTLSILVVLLANLPIWARTANPLIQASQVCSAQLQTQSSINPQILAQTFDADAYRYFQQGQHQQAVDCWQQAGRLYTQTGNTEKLAITQLNQAQALQSLGFYLQAKDLLLKLEDSSYSQSHNQFKFRVQRSLGDNLRSLGELTCETPENKDRHNPRCSLEILAALQKQKIDSVEERAAILISLGNTQRAIAKQARDRRESKQYSPLRECKYYEEKEKAIASNALNSYKNAADQTQAVLPHFYLQSQLNRISLLRELGEEQTPQTQGLLSDIESRLQKSPSDRTVLYARLNLAQTLSCFKSAPDLEIRQLLTQSLDQSIALNDLRAKSYALGYLGRLDEKAGKENRASALKQTQDALLIAQSIGASEITYRWQWQLGRILAQKASEEKQKGTGKETAANIKNISYGDAIAAYQESVKTLKAVRSDLLAASSDIQFSFRDDIEPVYRELVELLLNTPGSSNNLQDFFKNAIQYVDELQLAEIENFFRCSLLTSKKVQIDKAPDRNAAIFYMVFLSDRVDVMLKLPNQENLIRYSSTINRSELEQKLEFLRTELSKSSGSNIQETSQVIYDALLKQAEHDLEKAGIKTLVFVLDGNLRDIPMSALYDGQKYLIEKYAVAITPGLELLGPKQSGSNALGALIVGSQDGGVITIGNTAVQFSQIPKVEEEVKAIKALLPKSKTLLNSQFTEENFRQEINSSSYPIVHIATHGQFSSDPKETFILMAPKNPVNIDKLQSLLRGRNQNRSNPIELLVFSACETASGDRRATLGLAGIALRAGAFGTLASLWTVNDQATAKLMTEFYRVLSDRNTPVSKAEALRQAQLSFLRSNETIQATTIQRGHLKVADADFDVPNNENHPRYWAPFVLVGNWR